MITDFPSTVPRWTPAGRITLPASEANRHALSDDCDFVPDGYDNELSLHWSVGLPMNADTRVKLLTKAGLSWSEFLALKPAEPIEPLPGTWRAPCAELIKWPGAVGPGERGFVADSPRFQRLSTKQRYILTEIANRCWGNIHDPAP
jgi:hypothetical protein